MRWVLVLMVIGSSGCISTTIPEFNFSSEKECKYFVKKLRSEHKSKRIDASCIPVDKSLFVAG